MVKVKWIKKAKQNEKNNVSKIHMHQEPLKVPEIQRVLSSWSLYFLCSCLFRRIPKQFNIITGYSPPHLNLSNSLYQEITRALIITLKRGNHSATTSKAFE